MPANRHGTCEVFAAHWPGPKFTDGPFKLETLLDSLPHIRYSRPATPVRVASFTPYTFSPMADVVAWFKAAAAKVERPIVIATDEPLPPNACAGRLVEVSAIVPHALTGHQSGVAVANSYSIEW